MKILAISGSRSRQGKTARALAAIQKGAEAGNAERETGFLPEFKIERCRQCNADGWGKCLEEGCCVIKDDFDGLVQRIKVADLVVFASPVYYHDLSESMKSFLDRYRRITAPWFQSQGGRRPGTSPDKALQPAIGLCYAGGSGNGTTACAEILESILQTCGFDVVDMFLCRRQNLEFKLPLLEKTGRWLATRPTNGPRDAGPQPGKKVERRE